MAADWLGLNGDVDDDTALRRAIAMSVGAVPPEGEDTGSSHATMSLPREPSPEVDSRGESDRPGQAVSSSMSTLGLDRKTMEEERLARLRKRKAETSSEEPRAQRAKLPSSIQGPDPGLKSVSQSAQRSTGVPKAYSPVPLRYPRGIVLRTWVKGSPRDNDITIEEVLQKDDLELAVLSSFQWDEDWLFGKHGKVDMRRTRVLLIAYAKDDTQKAEMRNNVPQDLIRFVFPPMDSVAAAGCMHSKLQLLKYSKSLRIVVPTGNLVAYDWGETGAMENMVFLIDLPLIEDPVKQAKIQTLTPFGEELCYFLRAQGVDDKMIHSLRKYDFSETARYGFVHTIAGSHVDTSLWQRTGYCGLGRTVAALGLQDAGDVQLDYVCSSIGAVKLDLLTALYNACQGDSGIREYEARTSRPRGRKGIAAPDVDQVDLAKVRVYFPSRETVVQSRGGKMSAGTVRFQSNWWNAASFPRQVLRDCVNTRPGVLMHSKIMFVRQESGSNGWAYIGSHNLSESAWGRLVKDSRGKPKLNARNWECGVVVAASPPTSNDRQELTRGTRGAAEELDMFRGLVPIPMELPGLSYQADTDARQPWFVEDSSPGC
ncbi:unnamed protein product [Discula destructiva]